MGAATRPCLLESLFLLAFLAVGFPIAAQRYHVETYTQSDGLPSATVRAIAQDLAGRMWFATRAGVACYDGWQWRTFGNFEGLPISDFYAIHVHDDGRIFVAGTKDRSVHVCVLSDERWKILPACTTTKLEEVTALGVVKIGERTLILVGTSHGALHVWSGAQWRSHYLGAPGGTSNSTNAIVSRGSQLYLGMERGLRVLDETELESVDIASAARPSFAAEFPNSTILGMTRHRGSDRIVIVGDGWIGALQADDFELITRDVDFGFPEGFRSVVVEPDGLGGLYFGNPALLYHCSPRGYLEHLRRSSGVTTEGATSLCLDRESNLWVGSLRGVTKIISRRFANYDREHGLFMDEVSAVFERRSGEFVLGHPGGLSLLDDEIRKEKTAESPFEGRVLDLAETSDGTLWIAANRKGLGELRTDGSLHWHETELESGIVASVCVDSRDRLWISSDRVLRRETDGFVEVDLGTSSKVYVRRLQPAAEGKVFAATYRGGLYLLGDGAERHWMHGNEERANSVYAVLEMEPGTLWVGTEAGLFETVGNRLEKRITEPIIDRAVYSIERDRNGRVWFGTDFGVKMWTHGPPVHFTARDGLIGAETNRGGLIVDRHNRVWIGMDRGLSVYDSRFDIPRSTPPTVEITSVTVGAETLSLDAPVTLSYEQNSPTFEFRAISFIDESRVKFRVLLEGFDEGWSDTQILPQRTIRFTNLPAGDYRLAVQAVDVEGKESEVVRSATLTVRGPFWASPWFAVVAIVSVMLLAYGIVTHVAQRQYAKRLEREVSARTQDLAESQATIAGERERLAVTLGSIADGVVTTDERGTIALWNPGAEKITGRRAEEVVGRNIATVLDHRRDDGEPKASDLVANVMRGDASESSSGLVATNLPLETAAGEQRLVDLSGAPISGSNEGPSGVVLAFRDVTDRRQVERELAKTERLESLGVLAGGIAHDFNNLLTVVLGGLSILDFQKSLPGESIQTFRDISVAAERAKSLTDQLLTFSKGGAPVRKAASIADAIRDTAAFALHGTTVGLEADLPDDLWVVEIDEGQMSQVLNNLLINARQAMPEGGTIRIRARNTADVPTFVPRGTYVVIEVEDEGCGIPERHLGDIFNPFFSTKEEGSGLGLAVAHSIVERHDGRLTVESVEGRGSVFRIFLPASTESIEEQPQPDACPSGTGHVLVMDDDELVRDSVTRILGRLGYTHAEAANGEEAVERYRRSLENGRRFDVVLADLTVPGGMGGKEAARHLKELDDSVRIIVVSGYSNDPILADPERHGFCACLAKPFRVEDLARILGATLNRGNGHGDQGTP